MLDSPPWSAIWNNLQLRVGRVGFGEEAARESGGCEVVNESNSQKVGKTEGGMRTEGRWPERTNRLSVVSMDGGGGPDGMELFGSLFP
jgi:hypothetical protein